MNQVKIQTEDRQTRYMSARPDLTVNAFTAMKEIHQEVISLSRELKTLKDSSTDGLEKATVNVLEGPLKFGKIQIKERTT